MNRLLLWITTAVLGTAATLMTSLAGLPGSLLFLLLATPLIVRGDHATALSGLLMGFGASWPFLMARQFATGGTLDNAGVWMAVGILPLLIGCALLGLVAVRELRRSNAAGRC
jgi:hypothetical protein